MRKIIVLLILLSLSTRVMAGKNLTPPKHASEIFVQLSDDNRVPYDLGTNGFSIISFYDAVLGRLLKMVANFELQPGLLQSAYWDFGNKTYVLKLKTDLFFHHGRRVNLTDLEFSLIRYFLTPKRADPRPLLSVIDGTEDLKPGMVFHAGMVRGIKTSLEKEELRISLKHFTPNFLYRLTEGWLGIVPIEELEADYVTWKHYPIGSGPYKVVNFNPSTPWETRVRRVAKDGEGPSYIRWVSAPRAPNVDVISFTPINSFPDQLRAEPKDYFYGYTAIFFNPRSALGADENFRKAVALVIDRNRLVEGIEWVTPNYEMLLPQFPGRLNIVEKTDKAAAMVYLAKVPKRLVTKTIVAYSHSSAHPIAEHERLYLDKLREQVRSIGIEVEYRPTDHITFSDKDSEAVFRIDNRGSGYGDPSITFTAYGPSGFLRAFYPQRKSGKLALLLAEGERAQSRDQYSLILRKLSLLFKEDKYVIPLFMKQNVYWISSRIKTTGFQYGINFDPTEVVLK